MTRKLYLIIHDVRSAHNVGSLFRTADGMGVAKVYLTGYTGAPIDRFGRKDSKISKVSLGAEDSVLWEKREIKELIEDLRGSGVEVVALEQAPNAIPLNDYRPKSDIALIVGNEVEGIAADILALCDSVIEIPMRGSKESLNVSVAAGIALYHITVCGI